MNDSSGAREVPIERRAKALEDFSAYEYEAAKYVLKNQPEIFERATRRIAERGTYEAERYLEEAAEQPGISTGREITRPSALLARRRTHSFPLSTPSGAGLSLYRIAGYASLLGFCLLFWAVLLSFPLVDWKSSALGLALCVALGALGVACFRPGVAND